MRGDVKRCYTVAFRIVHRFPLNYAFFPRQPAPAPPIAPLEKWANAPPCTALTGLSVLLGGCVLVGGKVVR